MVMEKSRPATVITAAAIAMRICRAASGLPLVMNPGSGKLPPAARRSSVYVMAKSTATSTTMAVGTIQRVVRSASRRARETANRENQRLSDASLSVISGSASWTW